MKKINNYICVGLILNSIFLISNEFNLVPEFIKGLCAGSGIALILIGVYYEKHGSVPFKNCKKSLLNRLLSK